MTQYLREMRGNTAIVYGITFVAVLFGLGIFWRIEATNTVPGTATPTPVLPTPTVASTPTASGEIDPLVIGDPDHGQELFNTFQPDAGYMCATCHWADREDRLIGPGLLNIGSRAATRVEGQNAIQYLYTSIVNPGAYVVEEFPDGLMPQNWTQIYSQQDINDLIAYLLTLK
jgi:cytochrome c2